MRALLIVNPHATSTTRLRRDVIAHALASAVDLEIVETRYRGHGTRLARAAVPEGYGLVITLGGDGTVNEVVNGLLGRPPAAPGPPAAPPALPALAALPGGSANVFVRALGLSPDPVDATGQILEALTAGRCASIGVGLADDRYFVFNSGMGIDAEVVRAVEGRRAHGRSVSPALYLRMATRQFYRLTDRRQPAVTLEYSGRAADDPLLWCTVSNTSPWTYLGSRPVSTNPQASFDTGLDVFGMRSLGTVRTLATLRQMLSRRDEPPRGRGIVACHDLPELTLRASRPVAFQIDGEYMGEREQVTFRAVPDALRVVR
ncbi:MAG TPA: diacylglycerol kinase family protein [Streptosporangiaceae bacterium]|nr:diacylglycerol kinase family protein [Streptosporangiaceae bacterium]